MILQRWNYDTHEYEPFESPAKVTTLYSQDMDKKVDCVSCGKPMTYGDGYTSKEIHNYVGFGYPVCEDCYNEEIERWKEHRDE